MAKKKKNDSYMQFSQWKKKYKKKIEKNKWNAKKQKAEYKKYKKKHLGKKAKTGSFSTTGAKASVGKFATGGSGKLKITEEQKVKLLAPKNIGLIGSGIVFVVNSSKVMTFSEFERTTAGRWADHERLGKKPKKQFMGPECDTISMTITLDAAYGVNPRKVADNIRKLIEKGTPRRVIVGNKRVGKNKFVITKMTDTWDVVHYKGQVTRMTCKIELEEYV